MTGAASEVTTLRRDTNANIIIIIIIIIIISQKRLKIEVKLLLSANMRSYMLRRLAQQRMTLSDLEWPFDASRAISAVARLLVTFLI